MVQTQKVDSDRRIADFQEELASLAMTQAEMQEKILARAGEDGEFRARLLADPRDAIQELTGTLMPEAFTVEVHEESATVFHLVLPPDNRLTEEELAQVFGLDWISQMGSGGTSY